VFSTKGRRKTITAELQPRLWAYIGGIARDEGLKALAIGGIEDHIHVLLSVPPKVVFSHALQRIKGNSSKWVHDTFPNIGWTGWQEGYGSFSIGISQVEDTIAYIRNQKEHHTKRSFQEEFLAFLKKHGIEYDERYVWG
jgi:REP element-mobilizing transposase RayT